MRRKEIGMPISNPTTEYAAVPTSENGQGSPIWKPLFYPGAAKGYRISIFGGVKSPTDKMLRPNKQGRHWWIALKTTSGGVSSARVDKLVLSTFNRYEPLMTPDHIDGDLDNLAFSNLVWRESTPSELASQMRALEKRQGMGKKRRRARAALKTAAKAPVKPVPTPVEKVTMYRLDGVSVMATPEGGISALPEAPLSAAQVSALYQILKEVVSL